ncbi:MAG: serine/threonine protein kinase [Deltaproteobacteria bacterium]|nr:serine/threonine protein kinase [Deltaproteobacteria bacterium]
MAEAHTFGRYRVTKSLGAGAMGEVYEAVDDVLGREVAIKILRTDSGAVLLDDRFRNEARAIAQLSHPNIVHIFDIDLAATPPYLVMERVAGPPLADQLPLPVEQLIPLGIQIARALASAHAAGVFHRDVKPSNILAAGNGMWKLADFGVAHVPDSSVTMTGQFVGSPAYAAPEALVKGVTGAASDVYGLGATLYECAAGRWPRLEAKGALLAPVPPLAQLAPHVPAHVCAAIDRAVALDHEKRPTAAELAELLAKAPSRPAAARASWKPFVFAGAALVALAIGIAVTRGGSHDTPPINAPAGDDSELQDIANQANAGDIDGARERLKDYEETHGEDETTRDLRHQLDRLRKKHHGKHDN